MPDKDRLQRLELCLLEGRVLRGQAGSRVRFHYGSRGRRGNYSESELEEWACRFEDWRHQVEVFAYFNNDWEVFAVRNALWMKRRLGS